LSKFQFFIDSAMLPSGGGEHSQEDLSLLQSSRRRTRGAASVIAALCLCGAVALAGWAAFASNNDTWRGRTALEGINPENYKDGHKRLYRKIKDLYSWKLDWALGASRLSSLSTNLFSLLHI
jgi:hypothetical protein